VLEALIDASRRFVRRAERWPLALSILALVIATFASWVMARAVDYPAIEAALRHTGLEWLVFLLGVRFAAYAGYTLAHGSTLAGARGSGIPTDTRMKLVAFGASATSFGGGFSLDRRAMQRAGLTPTEASVRVLSLGMLEWATLAPVAWVCALTLLGSRRAHGVVTIPWAIGCRSAHCSPCSRCGGCRLERSSEKDRPRERSATPSRRCRSCRASCAGRCEAARAYSA
jgi:hypothetical protein